MSHSVRINLVGDSTVYLNGKELYIHDIISIQVNGNLEIESVCVNPTDTDIKHCWIQKLEANK